MFRNSRLRFLSVLAVALCLNIHQLFAAGAESWEEILARAAELNRPIVLEFTGSDWCPPCIMMQKQVFSKPEFAQFAEKEIVFVKLDFPRRTSLPADVQARNEMLAEKFRVTAFPTIIILNKDGKELEREVGFKAGGVEGFISWVKNTTAKS